MAARHLLLSLTLVLHAQSLYDKGNALLQAGRLAESETAYRAHLKANPNDVPALANLGTVLSRRENFAEAIGIYQRAVKLRPDLAPLHLNLGIAHFKTRAWQPALASFEIFLKAQPANRQAKHLKALCLVELERYADAAVAFESLLPTGDATVLLGLVTSYLKTNRGEDARKLLAPLIERGDSAELQLTLGQAYFSEGQDKEALEAFQKARQLNPALPTLSLKIGSVYWRMKNFPEALTEFRAELARFPESAEAEFTTGAAIALTGGDLKEAEALLRQSLTRKPLHARANFQLAKLIWQQRKAPEAIPCLEKAVKSEPDLREAWYLLGRVYQEKGRTQDAARAFARMRELADKQRSQQLDLFSEPPTQP
jgi:tetratricopeptide (TPR) repeat protein